MQLIEVPAKAGYVWFRQGIWLFRRSPVAFLTIFVTYLFLMWLIAHVPLIGGVLPPILIPGVTVGFMTACRDAVAGKPVFPIVLLDGFRSYGATTARRLIELGAIYAVAMALVLAASALADGGTFFGLMMGTASPSAAKLDDETVPLAMLVSLAAYVPVAMLFWFAPVLTAWHDVPPVKALFFSVVSCWRNRGAFIVYAALWLATLVATSTAILMLMSALGAAAYAVAAMFPATITLTTMLYCSIYATYRGCFGQQGPNDSPANTADTAPR